MVARGVFGALYFRQLISYGRRVFDQAGRRQPATPAFTSEQGPCVWLQHGARCSPATLKSYHDTHRGHRCFSRRS
jgi:hypothetical protein